MSQISPAPIDSKKLIDAWVNFNSTTTTTIRESYNIASVVDNGLGRQTITFIEPMDTADYVVTGITSNISNGACAAVFIDQGLPPTVNEFSICTSVGTGAPTDKIYVMLQVSGGRS